MPASGNDRGQFLLAEEYFATENDLFVETLRQINQPKALAALTDRWKKDPRPWARRQIFNYLDHPLNSPGHQPVVKRLFKQSDENKDHELMAAFMVAFDRQVRREVRDVTHWDFQTRSAIQEEKLLTPRDVLSSKTVREARNPATGELVKFAVKGSWNAKLFSYRTRYYLRRRAWRYFRHLGFQKPAEYILAISPALATYEDTDLAAGENILDSWSLMHACFGKHDALEFGATHIQLKEGRSLGELTPAPAFPDLWKQPDAAAMILWLVVNAEARLVRLWAMQLFQREHLNHAVELNFIISLLDHEDAEVQQFAAKLLETSGALGTLPVEAWLRLLQTKNEEALQRICDAFAKNVASDRLNLAQCVELACVRPVPVARLGQRYFKDRKIQFPADREQIAGLANARCAAVAAELTAWALAIIGSKENYNVDQVIRFFDALLAETRLAAWAWLKADSPGLADAGLWSRLTETPYDDVRLRVIDFLQRQTQIPGAGADQLVAIWRTVLLGVHRGGRQKAKAVQQIAHAIIENPARAETLLPVLAVAVRSVRGPEARAGLAAIAMIVEAVPQLSEPVRQLLPEMKFVEAAP